MRPMSPMNDHSTRPLRLAEALDLPKTSEGLSVLGADSSVHLTVLSEAFREVVSLEEAIALLLSPEASIALEASVAAIHSVVFPVVVTPVAEVMAEVTDNQGVKGQQRGPSGPLFLSAHRPRDSEETYIRTSSIQPNLIS